MSRIRNFQKEELLFCLLVVIAPVVILFFYLDLFDIASVKIFNFYRNVGLQFDGDQISNLYMIKAVIDNGWFFVNEFVGHPHIDGLFNYYDYPIANDSLNFYLIKILSIFTKDPFLVQSYFFILTFPLIALFSYIALRLLNISSFVSSIIAIIYSFAPYHTKVHL